MNPTAILALIGELYSQVAALTEENKSLHDQLSASSASGSSD